MAEVLSLPLFLCFKIHYYNEGVYSSMIEPVLGTLINFTGMRRVRTRGIQSAKKFMLGAAIAYNLKKRLNFNPKKVKTGAIQKLREELSLLKMNLNLLLYFGLEPSKILNS